MNVTWTTLHRGLAIFIFLLSLIVTGSSHATAAARTTIDRADVELTRISEAFHLEFSGLKDWDYEMQRSPGKPNVVVLRLPQLKAEAIAKLKSHGDPLVKSVVVNEQGIDGKTEVTITLSDKTDFFDYLADQPSRLIVDFFPKISENGDEPSAIVNAKAVSTVTKTLPPKTSKTRNQLVGGQRKPAGGDFVLVAKSEVAGPAAKEEDESTHKDFSRGIFDGGDPEFHRFAVKDYEVKPEAILASKANFYLPFPMLDLGLPQLRSLIMAQPTYEIVPNQTKENQEARVLLKLFNEPKPALVLKLGDEFLRNYPESQYAEMVRYMMADIHYKIWRSENSYSDFETAMNSYLQLADKYPNSPITPRTLLLMGYSYLNRGDTFAALKAFQVFARSNPESKHIDRVNISTAGAYLLLNRFDDAYNLLDQIEKHGKSAKAREEAAFRKGDVFFRKKDYAEAINQYKGAAQRFPAAVGEFPNAAYNTAEAQFNLEKYRESLDSYTNFLKKFPDHDHGGYAMTRIGELQGILGADPKRAEGAFMESYFRYRATPGAGIARIRMLTSRMSSMKEKEIGAALSEIDTITQKYANHPGLTEKKSDGKDEKKEAKVAEAEKPAAAPAKEEGGGKEGGAKEGAGKEGAGKETKSEEAGMKFAADPNDDPVKKNPELPGIEEFSSLLISDAYSNRDEFDTATKSLIKYFQKNPQSANRERFKARIVRNMTEAVHSSIDSGDFIESLRRYSREASGWLKNTNRLDLPYYVGKAYEQAGAEKEAASVYKETLKKLALRRPGQEIPIHEKTPKADALHLRLASLAVKTKDFRGAEGELKKIQDITKLTEVEQIEHAEVAADVSEARGQSTIAKKYLAELIKTWKGDPRLTASLHLRIAHIDAKLKDFIDAEKHLAQIEEFHKAGDYMPGDTHAQALELRGDLLVARGKRDEGVKVYRELLEEYEAKRPLSSVRYHLGQILYEDGDMKGAEQVWSELRPDRDTVWQRLAAEQMQGAKWQNEYKKYLKRIPAAADLRASNQK